MGLTRWVWLVALSTGVANAVMPPIGYGGVDSDGLGGGHCESAAAALNQLDGIRGVTTTLCGGQYPWLYYDPYTGGPDAGHCEPAAAALNKLLGSNNISCDQAWGWLAVQDQADGPAVAAKLTAILQGPTCKHGNPISGPTGGGYCTQPCDRGWQGNNCDSPAPLFVCNSSSWRCVPAPATAPGSGENLPVCLTTCIKPPPPPPPPTPPPPPPTPPPPCRTAADCGAHQTCDTADGSCHCASGWTGAACGVCDRPCGDRGSCVSTGAYAGVCLCDSGYDGTNCSTLLYKSPLFLETQIVTPEWGTLLNDWAKQPVDQKWALCYSSDTMNKTTDEFHKRCDQYAPTVTVAHNSLGRTFGGFVRPSPAQPSCLPSRARPPGLPRARRRPTRPSRTALARLPCGCRAAFASPSRGSDPPLSLRAAG